MNLELIERPTHLEITEQPVHLNLLDDTPVLEVSEATTPLSVIEYQLELEIQDAPLELELRDEQMALELAENPHVTINNFSGAGVVADDLTIEGIGIAADPIRTTADVLLASRRLSEFDTQTARHEARDNLGLNILDGGSFT